MTTAADPELDALNAAVVRDPLDDTARLVLADWLDEHPRPRDCRACNGGQRVVILPPAADNAGAVMQVPCPHCAGTGRTDPHRLRAEFVRLQIDLSRCSDVDRHCASRTTVRGNCVCAGCRIAGRLSTLIHGGGTPKYFWSSHYKTGEPQMPRCYNGGQQIPEFLLVSGPPPGPLPEGTFEYRRGFVELLRVSDPARPFLRDHAGLFRTHPVLSVSSAAHTPWVSQAQPGASYAGWWRWAEQDEPAPSDLPPEVWDALTDHVSHPSAGRYGTHWRWYATETAAKAALSRALVDLGRRAADLPAVEWSAYRPPP